MSAKSYWDIWQTCVAEVIALHFTALLGVLLGGVEKEERALRVLYSDSALALAAADLGEGRVVNISSIDLCHIGFLWSTHEREEKCAEQRKGCSQGGCGSSG